MRSKPLRDILRGFEGAVQPGEMLCACVLFVSCYILT